MLRPAVPDYAAVVENLLKFGGSGTVLSCSRVCLPSYKQVIKAGTIVDERNLPNSMVDATCSALSSDALFDGILRDDRVAKHPAGSQPQGRAFNDCKYPALTWPKGLP
jgi:hypothetical protein